MTAKIKPTSKTYTITPDLIHRSMQPLWSDEEGCWCSSDHWVYRLEYATMKLSKVFRLPRKSGTLIGILKDTLARSRIRQRWFPGVDISTLVELPNHDIVIIYDQVYWYSPQHHHSEAVPLNFQGEIPIAAPLRGGAAIHGKSHCVYFGEYLNGHDRAIRIFRIDVTRPVVETCWSFPREEIKHVHAIHYDRFRNRLWICTGDLDHESAFYYTDDEFGSVHRFAGDDQTWRAIAVLFDEKGMEWGMDAGKDAPAMAINKIYRYDFDSGLRTEKAIIYNPAYAACEMSDGTAIMQTTFEPGRKQDTPEAAALWHRDHQGHWGQIYATPYQFDPLGKQSRYGHLTIPMGCSPSKYLVFTPVNSKFMSRHLLKVSFNPEMLPPINS
jgi:hypothetical protein